MATTIKSTWQALSRVTFATPSLVLLILDNACHIELKLIVILMLGIDQDDNNNQVNML